MRFVNKERLSRVQFNNYYNNNNNDSSSSNNNNTPLPSKPFTQRTLDQYKSKNSTPPKINSNPFSALSTDSSQNSPLHSPTTVPSGTDYSLSEHLSTYGRPSLSPASRRLPDTPGDDSSEENGFETASELFNKQSALFNKNLFLKYLPPTKIHPLHPLNLSPPPTSPPLFL